MTKTPRLLNWNYQLIRSIFLGLLGFTLSWLISCTNNPTPSANPEIEFWTMQLQPQFTNYFNQLIAQFEQQHPGFKIRWVDIPWSAMETRILTAVSAKTAPDVVNLNPNFASTLAASQAWLNLNDKIPAPVKSLYFPKIWESSSIKTCQGQTCQTFDFGIPWYLTTSVTIYNTDILNKAGIVKPPKTFLELKETARQIKEKTGKYAFFVTLVPEDSGEVLQSFIQMGAQLVDNNNQAAFNTPEGKAVFQYWVDLYQQQLLPQEVLTQGHRQAIQLYQSGEIAFLSTGPQFFKTIADNAPAIAAVSDVAPQITGDTGRTGVAVMNLVIPRDTDQPDLALKFALFVTNNQNQLEFAKAAKVLPSTIQAAKTYQAEFEQQKSNPIDKAIAISASQLPQSQILTPAMKDLNFLQKTIYENIQDAMLKRKTIDQAITDAANTWNERVKS